MPPRRDPSAPVSLSFFNLSNRSLLTLGAVVLTTALVTPRLYAAVMSSSKLVPSNPSEVMVIRKVTDNITTCSAPFARFGKAKIGGRGTIVRMQNGGLAVFSPTAFTPEVKEIVSSMGEVKYLTALDLEHHIYLGPWHEAYPTAKVLAPEGLLEKRAKAKKEDVPIAVVFTAANKSTQTVDEDFDAEFDVQYVPEHPNKEIVVCYKKEKTLIEADLMFNLPAIEQYSKSPESPFTGYVTRMMNAMNNTSNGALWQRRFIWYAISAGNRDGFNKSVANIDKWDFERVIPCHGDVIETGGKGIFRTVMQWHLAAANPSRF